MGDSNSLKFCHERLVFLNPRRDAALLECGDNERSEAAPLLEKPPNSQNYTSRTP